MVWDTSLQLTFNKLLFVEVWFIVKEEYHSSAGMVYWLSVDL